MKLTIVVAALWLTLLGGLVMSAQNVGQSKYTVRVPGGLAFSEFEGSGRQ
jgi:hypothetical protein